MNAARLRQLPLSQLTKGTRRMKSEWAADVVAAWANKSLCAEPPETSSYARAQPGVVN